MKWYTNGWLTFGKHLINEGYIVGEPKATKKHSVEYLKSLGMVGFYIVEK